MLTNDIRLATQDDVDTIVSLGFDFWVTTEYYKDGIPYSFDKCKNLASILIDTGIAVVAGDSGFLLMVVAAHPFSANFIVASEVAFYLKPESRGGIAAIKMIKLAEQAAKDMGVNQFAMFSLSTSPKGVSSLYERLGLRPSETTFSKII